MRKKRQRGVALITAMLIFALVATITANLAWDAYLDVRRTMTMIYYDEGAQAALGAESWVKTILQQDLEDSETDHLGEIWASDFPVLPLQSDTVQGEVFGSLEDLQGRFNVNNLINDQGEVDEDALDQYTRLLTVLGLDPRFAGITVDWIDGDREASFPDGAEDPIYTGFAPPYRPPNLPLTNISELAALEGMDKATFDALAPHIIALPGRTTINVNTATAAVLQSLDESLSASDVEGLIEERAEDGFADVENTFSTLVEPEMLPLLDERSDYFQLKVVVQIATVRVTYFSVYLRGPRGDVVPILRSFGTT